VITVMGDSAEIFVDVDETELAAFQPLSDSAGLATAASTGPITVQITNVPRKFNVYMATDFLASHGFHLSKECLHMVHLPCERRRVTARGFLFVDAADPAVAQRLIANLTGVTISGSHRPLRAHVSEDQRGRQQFEGVSFPPGFEPQFAF
jgi:hypothetical protein